MGGDGQDSDGGQEHEEPRAPAGNSGRGSDSLLTLLRTRRLAQFRETASDPDAPTDEDPKKGE